MSWRLFNKTDQVSLQTASKHRDCLAVVTYPLSTCLVLSREPRVCERSIGKQSKVEHNLLFPLMASKTNRDWTQELEAERSMVVSNSRNTLRE